jgi:hypothetical protein
MQCSKTLERLIFGLFMYGFILNHLAVSQVAVGDVSSSKPSAASATASDLGVSFVKDSTSQIVVERDGKKYVVDLVSHEIREAGSEPSTVTAAASSAPRSDAGQPASPVANANIYRPGDDLVFSVPTGRPLDRHGLYLNFTHRFPYGPAFTGPAEGGTLLGLDNFAIPSFGLRYGVTSKLSVMATRSPSVIGRPIELMAAYNFLDEHNGNPINAAVRFSVDGQNDFGKNFAESFELVMSKSGSTSANLRCAYALAACPAFIGRELNHQCSARSTLQRRKCSVRGQRHRRALLCQHVLSRNRSGRGYPAHRRSGCRSHTHTDEWWRVRYPSSGICFWYTEKNLEACLYLRIHQRPDHHGVATRRDTRHIPR